MGLFSDTQINTLQLRCSEPTQLPARLSVEQRLRGLDFQPSGLPPAAILIIRQLPDPLPGGFRSGSLYQWQQRVHQALREQYQKAVRPRQGEIPLGAEAIVFEDQAEFLACLALDLACGAASGRWWWRAIRRALEKWGQEALFHLLLQDPPSLPAILTHLAGWKHAGTVLTKISPQQAAGLLGALQQVSGVRWQKQIDRPVAPERLKAWENAFQREPMEIRDRSASVSAAGAPAPPWSNNLTRLIPSGISPEAAVLLGAALSLSEQPEIARQPAFWQAAARWQDHLRLGTQREVQNPFTAIPETHLQSVDQSHPVPASPSSRPENLHLDPGEQRSAKTEEEIAGNALKGNLALETAPTNPQARSEFPANVRQQHPEQMKNRFKEVSGKPSPARLEAQAEALCSVAEPASETLPPENQAREEALQNPPQASTRLLAEGISTRLAGIFYLINLMTFLDLPGSLEAAGNLKQGLSAWALLCDLSRGLLGENDIGRAWDPVWEMLAGLAKNSEISAVERPPQYAMPAGWLEAPPKELRWACEAGRLYVWRRPGDLLLETPWEPATSPTELEILTLLSAAFPAIFRHSRPVISRAALAQLPIASLDALPWWVVRILPYVRRRLERQLGVAAQELAKTLFDHPGQLYLTATHLDIVMNLDEISIPVRRAGLDIDPGWVPAFGRIIQFHYQ